MINDLLNNDVYCEEITSHEGSFDSVEAQITTRETFVEESKTRSGTQLGGVNTVKSRVQLENKAAAAGLSAESPRKWPSTQIGEITGPITAN